MRFAAIFGLTDHCVHFTLYKHGFGYICFMLSADTVEYAANKVHFAIERGMLILHTHRHTLITL